MLRNMKKKNLQIYHYRIINYSTNIKHNIHLIHYEKKNIFLIIWALMSKSYLF